MPEDASLDDFLSAPSDEPDDGPSREDADGSSRDEEDGQAQEQDEPRQLDRDGEAGPEEDDGRDGAAAPTPTDVEPVVSTGRWVPDGTACPECDGAAARLWRDGDRLVCADCKSWRE